MNQPRAPGAAQEVCSQIEENSSHRHWHLSKPFWQVVGVVSGDLSKWEWENHQISGWTSARLLLPLRGQVRCASLLPGDTSASLIAPLVFKEVHSPVLD